MAASPTPPTRRRARTSATSPSGADLLLSEATLRSLDEDARHRSRAATSPRPRPARRARGRRGPAAPDASAGRRRRLVGHDPGGRGVRGRRRRSRSRRRPTRSRCNRGARGRSIGRRPSGHGPHLAQRDRHQCHQERPHRARAGTGDGTGHDQRREQDEDQDEADHDERDLRRGEAEPAERVALRPPGQPEDAWPRRRRRRRCRSRSR